MSEQENTFDDVFREKLGDYSVPPPSTVWENIETQRTYGHVVANRVSMNWRNFGALILILFGGSSAILYGEPEAFPIEDIADIQTVFINESILASESLTIIDQKSSNDYLNSIDQFPSIVDFISEDQSLAASNGDESSLARNREAIPEVDLVASVHQAGFSRPAELMDKRLSAYLSGLDGWESAKPKGFVHYYELEKAPVLGLIKNELAPISKTEQLRPYDYAVFEVSKKPIKERISFLFAFTPQQIHKSLKADYNLSSSYLNHRRESEQTRLAYTLEANLHYELKNHKFIETGINFTQIYEAMSFKGEKQFSNQYDFMEVPLLLGYEDRNSKWGWHVKGGFGVQVLNKYQGYIYKIYEEDLSPNNNIDPSQLRISNRVAVRNLVDGSHNLSKNQDPNEVLNLEEESENPYRKNGVFNVHLAAGLTYFHSINTTFVISPYYKRNINSITKEDALFKERLSFMGISLGTRIKF